MIRKWFSAWVIIIFIATLPPASAMTQGTHPAHKATKSEAEKGTGILLLAHEGSKSWNEEVMKVASVLDKTTPVEVALGMASKRTIQSAVDKLVARGVQEIIAVPLFVSPHSSVITSTEYLLGLRSEAPPEVAIFARMDHGHGGHDADHKPDPSFNPTTPVKSPVPIRMKSALGRHPLVADILLSRTLEISREPSREVVVLVAHGPVTDESNAKWVEDMVVLAQRMGQSSKFKRIEYLTVRDDAPPPIRDKAAAELRAVVTKATGEGARVLIVPLLLSYGGIEQGIKKRLEGLDYVISNRALLPDDRRIEWVRLALDGAKSNQ